jgi:hypothetical protein
MDEDVLAIARRLLLGACKGVETYPWFALVFPTGRLTVFSAWRLSVDDRLVAASREPESAAALAETLAATNLEWLAVKGPFNDLVARFGTNMALETFGDSWRYEHWQVAGTNGEMVIAGPGLVWSVFGPADQT